MRANQNRMTIYDAMEARGIFALNPANQDSRSESGESLYAGPVEFPKMFYHPLGLERVIVPGEPLTDSRGNPVIDYKTGEQKIVGEQREIIWQIAKDEAEAEALQAAGWHDLPGLAMVAAGKPAPPASPASKVKSLEDQVASLRAKLAEAGIETEESETSSLAPVAVKTKPRSN